MFLDKMMGYRKNYLFSRYLSYDNLNRQIHNPNGTTNMADIFTLLPKDEMYHHAFMHQHEQYYKIDGIVCITDQP